MINRKHLFDSIRASLFGGTFSQEQVEGIDAIIDRWEASGLTDLRWLAYILGTTYHETAKTMQPIEEFGKGKGRDYGKKLKMGAGPGKRIPYTLPDKLYFGRGHTQNTWYENYQRLTKGAKVQGKDWDFLNNPELLLQMEPSIWATYFAMQVGLYTGKKLADYFNDKKEDWVNARKIINGLDKAEAIGEFGRKFMGALTTEAT